MGNKAADDLVDIIRDIVLRELNKRDTTILCQIQEKKDEYHYDVSVVPDDSVIIANVLNPTSLDVEAGDYVYVYKIGNQLNNSFIVSKIMPYAEKKANTGLVSFTSPESSGVTGLVYANGDWRYFFDEFEKEAFSSSDVTAVTAVIKCWTPAHCRTRNKRFKTKNRDTVRYPCDCYHEEENSVDRRYSLQTQLDISELRPSSYFKPQNIVDNFIHRYNNAYWTGKDLDDIAAQRNFDEYGFWYKRFKIAFLISKKGGRTEILENNKSAIEVRFNFTDYTYPGTVNADLLESDNIIQVSK